MVHTAGLNHEVVTVVILGEKLDGGLGHLHNGGLGVVGVFKTVKVVVEMTGTEDAEYLALAEENAPGENEEVRVDSYVRRVNDNDRPTLRYVHWKTLEQA